MITQKNVETRLMYELLASELVEKTMGELHRSPGEWHYSKNWRDDQDRLVHRYVNKGMPVTVELTILGPDEMEVTRTRPTFVWEDDFVRFHEPWFNEMDYTGEWIDGIMFDAVRPSDFEFGMVPPWPLAPYEREGFLNGTPTQVVHFQPIMRDRRRISNNDVYDIPLEIENALTNAAVLNGPLKSVPMYGCRQPNYVRCELCYGDTQSYLTELGFVERKLWIKPAHHNRNPEAP